MNKKLFKLHIGLILFVALSLFGCGGGGGSGGNTAEPDNNNNNGPAPGETVIVGRA